MTMLVVCVCVCVGVCTHAASITTATPLGCRASNIPMAICLVRRSWTEGDKVRHVWIQTAVKCTCRLWRESAKPDKTESFLLDAYPEASDCRSPQSCRDKSTSRAHDSSFFAITSFAFQEDVQSDRPASNTRSPEYNSNASLFFYSLIDLNFHHVGDITGKPLYRALFYIVSCINVGNLANCYNFDTWPASEKMISGGPSGQISS